MRVTGQLVVAAVYDIYDRRLYAIEQATSRSRVSIKPAVMDSHRPPLQRTLNGNLVLAASPHKLLKNQPGSVCSKTNGHVFELTPPAQKQARMFSSTSRLLKNMCSGFQECKN